MFYLYFKYFNMTMLLNLCIHSRIYLSTWE